MRATVVMPAGIVIGPDPQLLAEQARRLAEQARLAHAQLNPWLQQPKWPASDPTWRAFGRCHLYRTDGMEWGRVELPPRPGKAAREGYTWKFTPWNGPKTEGRVKTLDAAKRAVERAYREWWRARGS